MIEREMSNRAIALEEHKRVIKQMSPLEPTRRALQNVAGVLVPRTVEEATAELQQRVDTLSSSMADLTAQHKAKADALRAFMTENHLRITNGGDDQQFSAIPRQLDPNNASSAAASSSAPVTK